MKKQKKPTGITSSIQISSSGIRREIVDFPNVKAEIELLIAKAFCLGKPALNPHISKYGFFTELESQAENSIDFKVRTDKGFRWLELAEFSPLKHFNGKYDNVSATWDLEFMKGLFFSLIKKKCAKSYGDNVILLIYKTHDAFFIPPPLIRQIRSELLSSPPKFESIYFISTHSEENTAVWQVWPADVEDVGPMVSTGTLYIGFD